MRVEHYRRTDQGWQVESLTHADDALSFEAVRFALALRQVYFGVEFD